MEDYRPPLATEKIEVVMLNKKWAYHPTVSKLNGHIIPTKRSLKYIEDELDTRLIFGPHMQKITVRAAKSTIDIGHLMSNLDGPF